MQMNEFENRYTYQKLGAFIFYVFMMTIFASIIALVLSAILYQELNLLNLGEKAYIHVLSAANFYAYLALMIVFIPLLWRYYQREIQHLKRDYVKIISYGAIFWFVGLAALMIASMILTMLGITNETSENQQFIETTFTFYPLYIVPMTVIFAPIIEETIFRGIIFQYFENLRLPAKLNTVLAFLFGSFTFGLIHVTDELFSDPLRGLLLGLPYIALGLVLSLVYYLTKSIIAAIITHFMQNSFSVILQLFMLGFGDDLSKTHVLETVKLFFQTTFPWLW
jgi:uncharacterized protein